MRRDDVERANLKEITRNPNFKLCGIKVVDMRYNGENKLFFLERGICRITSGHLVNAMRSPRYKTYLEKEIDLRKKF